MTSTEKKINKRLVGAIIGGALLGGAALSSTKKGRSFWSKIATYLKGFINNAIQQGEKLGGSKKIKEDQE